MKLLSQLINGLNAGSIYALIALGYTMVYGIAKMINFAHGDIIMVGAYVVWVAIAVLKLPVSVGLIIGVAACAVLGIFIEKVAYKPLRKAPPLAVLITAIGVSYFLQSASLLIFSSAKRTFPVSFDIPAITIGSLVVPGQTILILVVTSICMIALHLFINKTKAGSAMLAVSEDKDAAQLMGVNVNKTISMTFAIGSALAAVAGVLFASSYVYVYPTMGSLIGIKAFVAAVLGGIGSVPGAMLGGILLGLIESLSKTYLSTQLSNAIVFGILILVLLVRPSGLLGKSRTEKV
ncbi:branched-chain amino acid transport system permease protein [Mobilisporobacter senegalensis]|uniref:Branched-chain amino acid transport system permease protein n=1 Tax=Mobilisporobacter senegalensis TaxID=1329262 RepID=A0A3N1XPM3_9FIRM|nr:branched-chain amino acid ABC transporter permease [Mobilisporobacter senegalensis]ROR28605.1 branched-chain amino acid transport system permease protein [Mobilisporobacter senegalensis]